VGFSRCLQLAASVLENDFRFANGESVFVGNPAAQDEGIVVKAEFVGVDEEDFADLDGLGHESVSCELYAVFPGGFLEDFAEVKEARAGVELVGPQDELAADVLRRMDGHAIGIPTGLELRYASDPALGYRLTRRSNQL